MESQIKISIVIPVYNVEDYLEESLTCIKNQTFQEYEIICVDDGSTDNSPEILRRYAQNDNRYVLLTQKNRGGGAARNTGLAVAKGEYIIFLDSDDRFSSELLEKTYMAAVEYQADIVAFYYSQFNVDGSRKERQGIRTDWLPENKKVFNYVDCPDQIMSVIDATPWNKLYRRRFIIENNLLYDEIFSSNDLAFAAVSLACAGRITYIKDSLVEYRKGYPKTTTLTNSQKLDNRIWAVNSAVEQAKAQPYSSIIMNAIHRLAIDKYVFGLKINVSDFKDKDSERYYEYIHQYFLREELRGVTSKNLHNEQLFREFCIIRENDYQSMCTHMSRKMIVSLTSYPARINNLSLVLDSIYSQSRKADDVVLWLADTEFPNLENDLPDYLKQLAVEKKLIIRWCENLKPHNKYFYALQEYTDALVVTVDDDIIYPPYLLEKLFESYLCFPKAVSAARAHLITITESNELLSYDDWIKEVEADLYSPSMQLFATGVGGVLYPPGTIRPELFDKEAIKKTCLMADDLWLKAMELLSDIPVVVACPYDGLHYVPGSQEETLWHKNVSLHQNDVQLAQINEWLDSHYEKNILINKLTAPDSGERFLGIEALCRRSNYELKNMRKNLENIKKRLQTAYEGKSEINVKLQRTYHEKSELRKKLQTAWDEKSELNKKLKKIYEEKSEINAELQKTYKEKSEINAELQKTYKEKSEINAELQKTYKEKSEINAELQKTYKEKSEINAELQKTYKEKAERGIEIKKLALELTSLQKENERLKKYIEQEENKKISVKVTKLFGSISVKKKKA